jgi:hypothetical protein
VPVSPAAGLGLLLCDLVQGRDSDLELDLDRDEAERSLRAWLAPLLAARPPAVLAGLRRNAAAVSELFPWLERALGAVSSGRRPAGERAGPP